MIDVDNEVVKYGENVLKSFVEQNPFVAGLIKTIDDKHSKFVEDRINYLESRIKNLEFFVKQISYLIDDNSKYIHLRNFLSFYFTKTDPALVETSISIFLDYINEKYNDNIYDLLLDKMCLLSRESLSVMKKIKLMSKNGSYYDWKDFLNLYSGVDQTLEYRDILTSENFDSKLLEISYGFKNLIENDFIISLSANYAGFIDVYNVDKFSVTSLGYLLFKYI